MKWEPQPLPDETAKCMWIFLEQCRLKRNGQGAKRITAVPAKSKNENAG